VLANLGYTNVTTFDKSADCLHELTRQPQVIFLDYQMDNLNGIDILKKIKRFNPNIIVLFISAQDAIQVAVNSLKYGAFDYIVKKDFTEEKIKIAMEKVELLRELLNRKKGGILKRAIAAIGVLSGFFFFQKMFAK
jgi:DNA-binding NtrC family response regulator